MFIERWRDCIVGGQWVYVLIAYLTSLISTVSGLQCETSKRALYLDCLIHGVPTTLTLSTGFQNIWVFQIFWVCSSPIFPLCFQYPPTSLTPDGFTHFLKSTLVLAGPTHSNFAFTFPLTYSLPAPSRLTSSFTYTPVPTVLNH